MKKVFIIVPLVLLTFSSAYCGTYPERIISLGPVITEELFLLGAGEKVVGVSSYCIKPREARSRQKVGTVIDVNIEKVLLLKPDMVLATTLTPPRQLKRLNELGIKVVTFPYYESLPQICEQFLRLGKLVGEEKRARGIVADVEKKVRSIESRVSRFPRPKVFVQIGSRPLFTVTGESFINDFIELAGGINIASRLSGSGLYSVEEVIRQNPDIIIIATMGIVAGQEKKKWEGFKAINAARHGRIYIMDSYKMCSPTPLSFVETLEELVGIIHPETKV